MMISKKEKHQEQMAIFSKKLTEILKDEINSTLGDKSIDYNKHNFTNWLKIKLGVALKQIILPPEEEDRIKIFVNTKVEGIFNKKKYSLVLKDTFSNKIVCVINIQKVFFNINTNLFNLFKDTLLNSMSLDGKNIPLYTLILLPTKGYNKTQDGLVGNQEMLLETNIYRLLNANNYKKMSFLIKLLLVNDEIKNEPLKKNADLLTDMTEILLYRSSSQEKRDDFENKIMIKNLNGILNDIYRILYRKD